MEKDADILKRFTENLRDAAKFLNFAPVLPISALTGKRVPKIFDLINTVYGQFSTRIGTGPLNKIFEQATTRTEPSLYQGRRLKFFYATQITTKPPTFICFVNFPEGIHFSYERYLINQVRQEAGLDKTPMRLFFRKRNDPEGRMPRKPKSLPKTRKRKSRT